MGFFLMTCLLLTGVFMILIVLIQRGRGGGLAGALGGAGGQSALGTRAGDVMTKVTCGVAVIWVLLAGLSGLALRSGSLAEADDITEDEDRSAKIIQATSGDNDKTKSIVDDEKSKSDEKTPESKTDVKTEEKTVEAKTPEIKTPDPKTSEKTEAKTPAEPAIKEIPDTKTPDPKTPAAKTAEKTVDAKTATKE